MTCADYWRSEALDDVDRRLVTSIATVLTESGPARCVNARRGLGITTPKEWITRDRQRYRRRPCPGSPRHRPGSPALACVGGRDRRSAVRPPPDDQPAPGGPGRHAGRLAAGDRGRRAGAWPAVSAVADQATALRERHGERWKIWYVPLALGGYTWCARIHGDNLRNVLHADTAEHLDEHIRLREEDLAADARLSEKAGRDLDIRREEGA